MRAQASRTSKVHRDRTLQLTSARPNGRRMAPPTFQLLAGPPAKKKPVESPYMSEEDRKAKEADMARKRQEERHKKLYGPDLEATHSDPELAKWYLFAEQFNSEFTSILHCFEAQAAPAENAEGEAQAAQPVKKGKIGEQSGAQLSGESLRDLFTTEQRDLLMSFFQTRMIPERLFNGDEFGATTASQRLLMSAHILSKGKYMPGSFVQKIHARMCYHFIQITQHYAGATPKMSATYAGGPQHGLVGNFDHAGGAVFGTGKETEVFRGSKTMMDKLPEVEEGGLGPLPDGSSHAEEGEKEAAAAAEDKETKRRIHRRDAFPYERFNEIKQGDWIWYYNGNKSAGGSHSVMFSRWAGPEEEIDGVKYRTAILFSQRQPEWGGVEHIARFGGQYYKKGKKTIYPITSLSRVNEEAGPAQSADQILPQKDAKGEEKLSATNASYVWSVDKHYRFKGKHVDLWAIKADLRKECLQHIRTLRLHLTPGQKEMLTELAQGNDLEDMIRLTQRLREMSRNGRLMEGNMYKVFTQKLDGKHARAKEAYALAVEEVKADLAEIDSELLPMLEELNGAQTEKDGLKNHTPGIKAQYKKAGKLKQRINELKRFLRRNVDPAKSQALDEALEARKKALAKAEELRQARTDVNKRRRELNKAIAKMKRDSRRLGWKKDKVNKRWREAKRQLPWGSVHPGKKGKNKIKVTGKLQDLMTREQLRQYLRLDGE